MKVKKILILIVASLCLFSFTTNKETKQENENKQQQEFIYSKNIQDTFFGVKFGASHEEVKKAFAEQGLYLSDINTREDKLAFVNRNKKISFGGGEWNYVIVSFSKGKFYLITFQYATKYKETALETFDAVLPSLSSKYNMNKQPIEDENIYKDYRANSKDGKLVFLYCHRAESSRGEMRYYTNLEYSDCNYYKQ